MTSRRQQILNMYLENDMSLSEIAERLIISRQAVHDNIQKAIEQLEQYELTLGMVQKDKVLLEKLNFIIKHNQLAKDQSKNKSELAIQLEELKELVL